MKRLIKWWVQNKIAGNILMASILVTGFMTYFYIGKQSFPSATFPAITVSVAWPGASPQEVEEQIVLRLENAYLGLNGVRELSSTAYEGFAQIWIIANNNISKNRFLNDVKLRTDSVSNLPQSSYPPRISLSEDVDSAFNMVLYGPASQKDIQKAARNIRDDINKLPGDALATITRFRSEEISIEIPEHILKEYHLTFDQIAHAIQRNSLNLSSGDIYARSGKLKINTRERAESKEAFENIIIKQTPDGRILRVKDIANIKDGYTEKNFLYEYNGQKAVSIDVLFGKQKNDILKMAKSIKKYVQENQNTYPGVTVKITRDKSKFYKSYMNMLGSSAINGLLLVCIILILFLHPIIAFWVSVGIATAFCGAFIFLPFMNVSLNTLSFFAFILVIGIIVDDALIVGENVFQHFERGESGEHAAINGTAMVAKPVLFAVITTIMMFLPWMMNNTVSQYTRSVSIVVILALSFSLIESFFILPGHLSHLRKKKYAGIIGKISALQQKIAHSLVIFSYKIYRPCICFCIRFRYITFAVFSALLLLSISLVLSGKIPFQFTPNIESNLLRVKIRFSDNTDNRIILDVRKRINQAKKQIEEKYNDIKPSVIEHSTLQIFGNTIYASLLFLPPKERNNIPMFKIADQFKTHLGEIPLAQDVDINFVFTGDRNQRLSIQLSSKDIHILEQAKEELKQHLRTYTTTYSVRDNHETSNKDLRFTLKPGATALGLTLSDISNQVRKAYYGIIVQRIARNGQDVEVKLRYPKSERSNLESLNNFRIRTQNGREIPLFSVVDYHYEQNMPSINRQDRKRTIRVITDIIGKNKNPLIDELEQGFLTELTHKYPSLTYEVGERRREIKKFASEMYTLSGIILLLMYILLAVAFKSYFQPLLIMSAIVFAFAGAIYGLFFLGLPIAIFSLFGIAAAAGVIINDNLILIDFANRLREQGIGAFQSLVDAGIARFRPILLTSLTTCVGILPLILERSAQAQFLKPMVVSLGAGILFAFFLTLFLVPSLYAIGVDIVRLYRWALTGKKQEILGTHYDPDISHIQARIKKAI